MSFEKWLGVAKQLESKETSIVCPFCEKGKLKIVITKRPTDSKQDVYVSCPNCNENTVFSGVDSNWPLGVVE